MDFSTIIERTVPHILTGAGGAVVSVWRYTRGFVARLGAVESAIDTAKLSNMSTQISVDSTKRELLAELETLRRVLQVLRQESESEVEDINQALRVRGKEQADIRRLLTKLTERYIGLEARLEAAEATLNSMNDSLKGFMREQQEQWQTTAKALGQIDGYLRGISKRTLSGTFPPVK